MAADTLDSAELTEDYILLTAGPALITLKRGNFAEIRFAAGGVPANTLPGHIFSFSGLQGHNYTGTLNIYAKTSVRAKSPVVVTYTE